MAAFLKKIKLGTEVKEAIHEREMGMENLINKFRFSFLAILITVQSVNIINGTYKEGFVAFEMGFSIIMIIIASVVHFLSRGKKYIGFLKYLTVTIDLATSFFYGYVTLFISKVDIPGGSASFLLVSSIIFIFFNSLSLIRSNSGVVIYSGVLTVVFNALMYILAKETTMPLYFTSVFIIFFTAINVWVSRYIINFFVVNNKLNFANDKIKQVNVSILQRNEEIMSQKDEIQTQKEIVEEYSKHITDSIKYAQRIQEAVLPSDMLLQEAFDDNYFVFYRPRDIVSGDFYWMKKTEDRLVIAIADCTGHGVPGAFVSLLGISFLNEVFQKQDSSNAASILNDLRDKIKTSLKQTGSFNEQKDGMDMALCIIDTITNKFHYAGAYNPLYIISGNPESNGRMKELEKNPKIKIQNSKDLKRKTNDNADKNHLLIEVKADRQPIGVYKKEYPFTNHTLQLRKGDSMYMFSDGYIDQFESEREEKFKIHRFKNLLVSIYDKPFCEQKTIIESVYDKWRGDYPQIDDVLVMGLKL